MSASSIPFKSCPRFSHCNVNRCPLDPAYPLMPTDRSDKQTRCTLAKSVRRRIGSQFPNILPLLGLTPSEANGEKKWKSLTAEEKAASLSRLTPFKRGSRGQNPKTPQDGHSGDPL